MRIGELAKQAGVSVQAIRFYERRGLIQEPPRTRAGYRVYSQAHLQVLLLIRKAQHFGFRLKEIDRLLPLCFGAEHAFRRSRTGGEQDPTAEIARMCAEKLTELDERIRSLMKARRDLAASLHLIRGSVRLHPRPPVLIVSVRTPIGVLVGVAGAAGYRGFMIFLLFGAPLTAPLLTWRCEFSNA